MAAAAAQKSQKTRYPATVTVKITVADGPVGVHVHVHSDPVAHSPVQPRDLLQPVLVELESQETESGQSEPFQSDCEIIETEKSEKTDFKPPSPEPVRPLALKRKAGTANLLSRSSFDLEQKHLKLQLKEQKVCSPGQTVVENKNSNKESVASDSQTSIEMKEPAPLRLWQDSRPIVRIQTTAGSPVRMYVPGSEPQAKSKPAPAPVYDPVDWTPLYDYLESEGLTSLSEALKCADRSEHA